MIEQKKSTPSNIFQCRTTQTTRTCLTSASILMPLATSPSCFTVVTAGVDDEAAVANVASGSISNKPTFNIIKEGNILFNDALNTFYLRLYGIRYMVKDHSDSEKRNLLSPHRLHFPISSKGSFICTIPQTG